MAPLCEFLGFQRKRPIPGLDGPLMALVAMFGPNELAALCPGCLCLTTDLNGC